MNFLQCLNQLGLNGFVKIWLLQPECLNIVDILFKDILCLEKNPIGQVADYMIQIEFQSPGSPHAHFIIWIKDAPTLL